MIEPDGDKIRAIAWTEVFPWLKIIRVFRIAISFRSLLFGAVAILLTTAGWDFIGTLFSTESPSERWIQSYSAKPYSECPWNNVTKLVPDCPGFCEQDHQEHQPLSHGFRSDNPMFRSWSLLARPTRDGLSQTGLSDMPPRSIAAVILYGLWATAVWAFFGAAICRAAAVRLTVDEKVGLSSAVRFAGRKWASHFAAPLLPVLGFALVAVPIIVLGLIMRAGGFGVLLGGIFWPFALVVGFVMALLLLGILFAWPLMWGAISTEGSDSFDALSRSYAYLMQRPLHYLFYAVVAAFFGWFGWLLASTFASFVIWLAYWSAGWGCGSEQIGNIMNGTCDFGGMGQAGVVLIRFWVGCVKLLAVGYIFSYFWSASTAIYLLLRKDVDNTEMDEVFLEDQEEPGDLPVIGKDSAGAPVVEGDAADTPLPEKPDSSDKS